MSKVRDVMGEITTASEQQSSGVEEITSAVEQMNEVTQSTAANAEESASSAEELTSQAQQLQQLVATFALSRRSGRPAHGGPSRSSTLARSETQPSGVVPSNGGGDKYPDSNGSSNRVSEELIPFEEDALRDF